MQKGNNANTRNNALMIAACKDLLMLFIMRTIVTLTMGILTC